MTSDATPIQRPPRVGEVVIWSDPPRGYAAVLLSVSPTHIRLLDSSPDDLSVEVDPAQLIPTGKTPEDLVRQFRPAPSALTAALAEERSLPDFDKAQRKTTTRTATKATRATRAKEPNELNDGQRHLLEVLLAQRAQELGLSVKKKGADQNAQS